MSEKQFDEWVVLELMGHRRLAGKLTEQEVAGASFLRLDMPRADGTTVTQLYGPQTVYCITPTTEEIARAVAIMCEVTPVHRWELPAPPESSGIPATDDTDTDEPDYDGDPAEAYHDIGR